MGWSKVENIKNVHNWLPRKIELIELKETQINENKVPNIYRGGIFNVELGMDNIGGEKNKTRPCLVLTKNQLNNGSTVAIIPLSTKFRFNVKEDVKIPKYNNHYILLKTKYTFLKEDSCLKMEDIRSIDKVRIREHLGNVSKDDLDKLLSRVKFTFGF